MLLFEAAEAAIVEVVEDVQGLSTISDVVWGGLLKKDINNCIERSEKFRRKD